MCGGEVQDLGLDRDVERSDGLVQQKDAWLRGERPGDRDALALAAGERPRQGGHLTVVQADLRRELRDPRRAGRPA